LRFQWAYWLGWAVQVAAIALGMQIATMFVLGGIFLALWAAAYFLGRKIEEERAEWIAPRGVSGTSQGGADLSGGDRGH
jgi:hypothetical protein